MTLLDHVILRNLLTNSEYLKKVIPFIRPSYFDATYKIIFQEFVKYHVKYSDVPTEETFLVELSESDINDDNYNSIKGIIPELFNKVDVDETWLMNSTEKWCQDRALHNAIMDSITIIDGKHKSLSKNALPELLQNALNITFDRSVGHDYIEDWENRFAFYNTKEDKIPFDIEMLNTITNGGLTKKTLNIILAGTGLGKSLGMCSCSASWISMGYNVLYITAEMSEEKIAERIDANLLDIPISEISDIPKDMFSERIRNMKSKTNGKLIIKEYPTASANVNHFRALLNELKIKKNFVPDVIVIDYLNICASSRMKTIGGSVNSYSFIKAIAEEFRGLAVEFNVPILSATQTTRSGFSDSDPGLEDTAESFGLPATADLMFALVSSEELAEQNLLMVKQLKNRYNDIDLYRRFTMGVDKPKMRWLDADQGEANLVETEPVSAEGFSRTEPVFDNTEMNERFKEFKI